jgi:Domain of unknown function (DUF3859)
MKLRRVPVPVRVASGFAVLGALLVTAYFLRDVPTERATAFPSHTQDPKSLEGRILQFGLCERTEEERYLHQESTAGYATLAELQLTVPTDTVPLKQGIGFGFRWTASGFSSRERVVITYRISHPPITRPDGKTLRGFTEDLPYDAPGEEIETTDCYFLSERHELVAGEWELAIVYRGKELVAKRFTVVAGGAR